MTINITSTDLRRIQRHGETAYPEEGAGLILGLLQADEKKVSKLIFLQNDRETSARHNRYQLSPEDYLKGELEAAKQGLDILGVFHSHPDHPNTPSEFDREWALPQLSYIITSIHQGRAVESLSWLLSEDRSRFISEEIRLVEEQSI